MLTIGTQKSDRITTITDTIWAEYISLDLPSKRVSFRNGVITIVSPGLNHERYGDFIRAIIWAYCRQHQIKPYTFNSYTLKEEGKEGKEPDVAYSFEVDKEKPDLAVEINLTSGNIDDLTKYQYLKIPEVWLWEQNKLNIFVLDDNKYKQENRSFYLDGLECDRVTEIVNSCFGKSVLEVEKYFDADI